MPLTARVANFKSVNKSFSFPYTLEKLAEIGKLRVKATESKSGRVSLIV